MKEKLRPAERLIVAADFKPLTENGCRHSVRSQVLNLADSLGGTGVYLKVNSALRALGYGLIEDIHARGLRVFADLKLIDISETLATDGQLLFPVKPELLTVMCVAGVGAMRTLKAQLPDTEVLGVTLLTSLKVSDTTEMFGCLPEQAVMRFANIAARSGVDGFISSALEVPMLINKFGDSMTYNTPAIRPSWAIVPGDDQNPERIMTPAKAIKAGVDRIVVGRPILRPPQGMSSKQAVDRTLEEIANACS